MPNMLPCGIYIYYKSMHVWHKLQECAVFLDKCRSHVIFSTKSAHLFLCVCLFLCPPFLTSDIMTVTIITNAAQNYSRL